jgi:hypothetical protein
MARKEAIDQYCKWCIYDSKEPGTWRQQTEACTDKKCPLYTYRPKTLSRADKTSKTDA